MRVRNRADFLSGLLFIALGLLGLVEALNYDMGTMRRMGAGYFPVILSTILAGLGLAIAVASLGWRRGTPDEADPEAGLKISWEAVRAVIFVTAALALFALGLPRFGLVLAVMGLVVVSSFADPSLSWRETIVIAVVMAAIAVAVFRWGIGLPFPIWPRLP